METTGVKTLLCPNCGAPIHHGDLECEYCGGAIYAGRAAEITVPAIAEAQKIIPEMQARIKLNPYDGDAYYQLALACFTLKLYDQAENALKQAERFSPGSPLVHYFTGLAILYGGEREILNIQPFRIATAHKQFETALSLDPDLAEARAYDCFTDALLARNREDYAGAITPLQIVVERLPKFAMGWQVLAACRFQTGDFHAAIDAAKRALELQPGNADMAYLVGAAYSQLNDAAQVESWARRVALLRGNPDEWCPVVREIMGQIE